MSEERIAIVQHGDYREACRVIASGRAEPYYGMAYSLQVLGSLVFNAEHLIVSLNAPAYDEHHDNGRWLSIPEPRLPRPVPRRWLEAWRARSIVGEVKAFRPTRLLLRSGGSLARRILETLARFEIDTLVVCANFFNAPTNLDAKRVSRLVKELNRDHVFKVGNHRWPATESMVRYGLHADKAIAWDWPNARDPRDYPVKALPQRGDATLLYVGSLTEVKGVREVVKAVKLLRDRGISISARIVGVGPDCSWLDRHAGDRQGIELLGRLGNDKVFEFMRQSTIVCVPSRHEFSEGMPLTLTEALASRTPVVVSDHPVFVRSLFDGQGVVMFAAGDHIGLADAITRVLGDNELYRSLSEQTEACYRRIECSTTFGDLIDMWRLSW